MIVHNLVNSTLEDQISDIKNHQDVETEPIIFHCYWDNNISPNQVTSILSCYVTNVIGTNNKIILWTQQDEHPAYGFLRKYCEIRVFNHLDERVGTPLDGYSLEGNVIKAPSFYSDYVRYIILSKYGGVYFDLDIFFFKSFSYLIKTYRNFVYNWPTTQHPNGAIYGIMDKKVVDDMISLLIKYGQPHLGFQDSLSQRCANQQMLNFNAEVDLHVLPSGWFDPAWVTNRTHLLLEYNDNFETWFQKIDNDYYYDDIYCYHWHNRNYIPIQIGSPFHKNILLLKSKLNIQ